MDKKIGSFFMKQLERKAVKVAETSVSKSCNNFIYEPKSPFLKQNTMKKK